MHPTESSPEKYGRPSEYQLYRYKLSHVELAVLKAILEDNSGGEFLLSSLSRIAAYSKLSRRTVQACINGSKPHRRRDGRIIQVRPGLIDKRVLVPFAPPDPRNQRPTTYRIQLEALELDPRVEHYLADQEQVEA